jgi:N-acetylglucosamine repressor
MDQNGISKLDLKRLNRMEILKRIIRYGPMSRIDLAQQLRLTRAAVTIITNEMIEQGILYEQGEQKATAARNLRGRKKILLDIHENYKFSFGVVIDYEKFHIGLTNLKGQTLDKKITSIRGKSLRDVVELIYAQALEILSNNCLEQTAVLGLGCCVSNNALPLFGKDDKEACLTALRKLLEMRFKIPVLVDGTTESLAVAEMLFNSQFDEKPTNMVFIRYGYDVDAAIMLGGEVYRGTHSRSGWFAHIVVDTNGERCSCGKTGCCITKMAIPGIIERIKELYVQGKTPILFEATGGNVDKIDFTIENLKLILEDEAVRLLYQDALAYLTTALDNLLTVLDPDKIVLFGFVFEKILDLEMLTAMMEKEHNLRLKDRVTLSMMQDSSIHLAGNGLCVQKLFIEQGGLQDRN